MTDRLFPEAAPGSQRGRTRAVALAVAATAMAGGALAAYGVRSAAGPHAPNCPPARTRATDWLPDDPDGCWEQRGGGASSFRTTWGGRYYYHWEPPPTSKYYGQGGVGG